MSFLQRPPVLYGAMALALGALGVVATLGAPACTVLTNDAPLDDAGLEAGIEGGAEAGYACTSCAAQQCTGAWAVCLTDSRCVALRGCDNPFSESGAGRTQCFCALADASPPGADGGADPLAAYTAFSACNDARKCAKCADDCSGECAGGGRRTTPGTCASDPADAASDADAADAGSDADASAGDAEAGLPPGSSGVDRCAACVSSACSDADKACAAGTECSAFLACAYACFDISCVDACGEARPAGKTSATELSSCTLSSCRSACGL